MSDVVLVAIIGGAEALLVAVIGGLFLLDRKKRKKAEVVEKAAKQKADAQAHIRAKVNALSMGLMSANTSLTIATAIAVKEGHVNGKMDTALKAANRAQRVYFNFINGLAAGQMEEDTIGLMRSMGVPEQIDDTEEFK